MNPIQSTLVTLRGRTWNFLVRWEKNPITLVLLSDIRDLLVRESEILNFVIKLLMGDSSWAEEEGVMVEYECLAFLSFFLISTLQAEGNQSSS